MSVLDRPALVPVSLGYCPCEGHPHGDGDIVYLYPDLSMAGGMAAQGAISESADSKTGALDGIALQANLERVWVEFGVAEWTFLDDEGDLIPVTPTNIRIALPYAKGGRLVATKADELYADAVTAPLVEMLTAQSKRGRTASTREVGSPLTTSRSRRRSQSSTATTAEAPPAA